MVFQEHNKSHNPKKQSLKGHFAKHLQKSFFIPQKSTQKLPNISRRHFPPGRDHLFDIKNYKQIHEHSAINIVYQSKSHPALAYWLYPSASRQP